MGNNKVMDPLDLISKGKIKRYFRATRKLNVPNLVFHITQRAAGREPLFVEDSDYLFMLWLIKEISRDHGLRIYALCLMPNHIHLLLSSTEPNLYDAMRNLFSRYAMKFNKKYERRGHLFGGPYRQSVCLDDSYLLAASLYIHLNPVRAELSPDPTVYRWSSCRLYCSDSERESFVDPGFVLNLLTGEDDKKTRYRQMLQEGAGLQTGDVIEKENAIESLRAKLALICPSVFSVLAKERRVTKQAGVTLLSVEELDILEEEVRNQGLARSPESKKAKRFVIEQLLARGYNKIEIANRLGVCRKTVYNLLKSTSHS
jgi:putative transposase